MMLYMRGNRRDYDTWEQEFGATGWSWEEVSHTLIEMPKRLSRRSVID
jgi:choline dehydrogenase-like flavoprotein